MVHYDLFNIDWKSKMTATTGQSLTWDNLGEMLQIDFYGAIRPFQNTLSTGRSSKLVYFYPAQKSKVEK